MPVIPLQSNRQVRGPSAQGALPQQSALPQADPVAEVAGTLAQGASQFLDNLAQREIKELNTLYTNSALADISQLETDSRARVIELAASGTGEKPFVKGVMDDFEERANAMVEQYPEGLRAGIRTRLLPLQETVAASALAVQKQKTEQQIVINTDTFQNNLVNQVRFGGLSEATALAQVEQFSTTLPDNLRLGLSTKLRESVRTATMGREMEANPYAFVKRVKAGEFNDVDASYVAQSYNAARNEIVRRQNESLRQQLEIAKLAGSDPVQAARLQLQREGIANPTRAQILDAQINKLKLHPVDVALLTKDEADEIAKNFQNSRGSVGGMIGAVEAVKAEYRQRGEDWDKVVDDVARFAKFDNPAMRLAFDYAVDPGAYPIEYGTALAELTANPKAGESAKKTLMGDDTYNDLNFERKIQESLRTELEVMARSGVPAGDLQEMIEVKKDIAKIMAAEQFAKGSKRYENVVDALSVPARTSTPVLDGTNAFYVPFKYESSLDLNKLEEEKMRLLESEDLSVPATFPSEVFTRDALRRNAGWTQHRSNAVELTANGAPVLIGGKGVVRTFDSFVPEEFFDFDPGPTGLAGASTEVVAP